VKLRSGLRGAPCAGASLRSRPIQANLVAAGIVQISVHPQGVGSGHSAIWTPSACKLLHSASNPVTSK
jgi:hypothetical protein